MWSDHVFYGFRWSRKGGGPQTDPKGHPFVLTWLPHLLFLDEPTSGLDPYTSVKIVDTINSIQTPEGKTPLKISIVHDMKVVKAISNKVLFIKNGKINWFGFVEDLENEAVENVDLKAFISHI